MTAPVPAAAAGARRAAPARPGGRARRVRFLYRCGIETSAGQDRRPPRRRSAQRQRQLRRRRGVALLVLAVVLILIVLRVASCAGCGCGGDEPVAQARPVPAPPRPSLAGDGVKVGTFLGNYGRRFYGLGPAPKHLDVIWKVRLGSGWSSGKYDSDKPSKWAGSGWTGQANIVVDGGKTYVLASSYEYKLRRIDAATGKVVWAYQYDDIIKSSPSVFRNPAPTGPDDKYIVVAGSRRGYPDKIDDPTVAPLRAVDLRQRQRALASAGAAHQELQQGLRRQRVLLRRRLLHRGRERLVLRARPPGHAAVAGVEEAGDPAAAAAAG